MDQDTPPTVAHAFVRSIECFGANAAIIPLQGGSITYAELGVRVATAVGALRRLECRRGDRVAIWLPNCPEWVVLQYAAALLGLRIVPVNARYRPAEVERVLRLTRAKCLFTQEKFLSNNFAERLGEIAGGAIGRGERAEIAGLPDLERIVFIDGAQLEGTINYAEASEGNQLEDLGALAEQCSPDDPLWLFWTSGTTSAPKGAIMLQSSIRNIWNWTSMAGYRSDDRVLMSRPLFYIAGNFWSMLGPMLHGAATVIAQTFTPEEMVDLCRRQRVTVLSGNPLLLKNLVRDPAFDPHAFEHVRFGYFGGTSVSFDEFKEIKEKIGFDYLLQPYGMTELEGFATSTRPDDPMEITYRTCGTALPGLEMRLVDPDTEKPVRCGEVGLLLTRGRGFVGYEAISEEDHARLFNVDGWFRTGDLLRQREDHRYEFVGRVKDLIKVGGENVTAGEIELILTAHPSIAEVAVVPMMDERRGEVPVAFVELRPGQTLSAADLQVWCRQRMAPYKIPASLHFVENGQWPMTPSGKIAKHQLGLP